VHRAVSLCHKFCEGKVPPLPNEAAGDKASWGELTLPFDLDALRARAAAAMETFAIKVGRCVCVCVEMCV
jgi:hypothetical protein